MPRKACWTNQAEEIIVLNNLKRFALVACFAGAAPFAAAGIDYQITTSGSTNPQDNGWRAINIVASTQVEFDYTSASYPGVGPVTDGDTDAWQIFDTNGNVSAAYWASNVPVNNSSGNRVRDRNWRFSAFVKALPSNEQGNAPLNAAMRVLSFNRTIVGAVSSSLGYTLTLEDVANGGTELIVNSDPTTLTTLTDGYHWVEMIWTTAEGSLDVYVDANLVLEDLTTNEIVNNAGNRIEFGDLQLTNSGVAGANWAFAEFVLDDASLTPIGVPEPTSLALLSLGSLLVARRRRA